MGNCKPFDTFKCFHTLRSDAISKTLSNEECLTLNEFGLERRKGIVPYEWLDIIGKRKNTELPPKEALYSYLKQKGIADKEHEQTINGWKEAGCKTIED